MGSRDASGSDARGGEHERAREVAIDPQGGGTRSAVYAILAVVVGAAVGVPLAFFALRDLVGAARVVVFVAAVVLGGFVGGFLAGASTPSRRAGRGASRRHAGDHS